MLLSLEEVEENDASGITRSIFTSRPDPAVDPPTRTTQRGVTEQCDAVNTQRVDSNVPVHANESFGCDSDTRCWRTSNDAALAPTTWDTVVVVVLVVVAAFVFVFVLPEVVLGFLVEDEGGEEGEEDELETELVNTKGQARRTLKVEVRSSMSPLLFPLMLFLLNGFHPGDGSRRYGRKRNDSSVEVKAGRPDMFIVAAVPGVGADGDAAFAADTVEAMVAVEVAEGEDGADRRAAQSSRKRTTRTNRVCNTSCNTN